MAGMNWIVKNLLGIVAYILGLAVVALGVYMLVRKPKEA